MIRKKVYYGEFNKGTMHGNKKLSNIKMKIL